MPAIVQIETGKQEAQVRQEVKHDLMTYFHCDLEHSIQVLVIVRVILVLFHRELG